MFTNHIYHTKKKKNSGTRVSCLYTWDDKWNWKEEKKKTITFFGSRDWNYKNIVENVQTILYRYVVKSFPRITERETDGFTNIAEKHFE